MKLHIRVTMDGKAAQLELMNGPYMIGKVKREDVVDMIQRLGKWLETEAAQVELIPGTLTIDVDLLDVIEMIQQFASSLRW